MSPAAFLTATGLTFTRACASTVQTSASTIDSSPAIDQACIGSRGGATIQGLVIEHNVATYNNVNNVPANPRNLSFGHGWTAGTGVVTGNFANGPDGTLGCSRVVVAAGQYGPYNSDAAAQGRYVVSSWQRSKDETVNGAMNQEWVAAAANDSGFTQRAATNVWGRITTVRTLNAQASIYDTVEGRAGSGVAAQARDVLVDFVQQQDGTFATEAIYNAAVNGPLRNSDILTYAQGSKLVTASGRIRFYARTIPKMASVESIIWASNGGGSGTSVAWYLFSWGAAAANYAYIRESDKKLVVNIAGGVVIASTTAVVFSANDIVEWDIEIGSGVASVASYRVNSGAWTNLTLGVIAGVPVVSGAMGLFHNLPAAAAGDKGQFTCWLQKVAFLDDGDLISAFALPP